VTSDSLLRPRSASNLCVAILTKSQPYKNGTIRLFAAERLLELRDQLLVVPSPIATGSIDGPTQLTD
jgi:hypothetical protein